MFIVVRMNITDDQGRRECLMNTSENSLYSRLAWASDGILPCSSLVIANQRDAGRSSCSSRLAQASDGVLPCSSSVIVSKWDAGWISCSGRLAGASGGKAGWPAKPLPQLAGLMSVGDHWWSQLPVLATSRLAIAVFARCKGSCDWC
jgi:hypothetical protein